MKAHFRYLRDSRTTAVVLTPETDHERMLLAAVIGLDAERLTHTVARGENGLIEEVAINAPGCEALLHPPSYEEHTR